MRTRGITKGDRGARRSSQMISSSVVSPGHIRGERPMGLPRITQVRNRIADRFAGLVRSTCGLLLMITRLNLECAQTQPRQAS
jgi:hypothetical protein